MKIASWIVLILSVIFGFTSLIYLLSPQTLTDIGIGLFCLIFYGLLAIYAGYVLKIIKERK